jgi:hypothetical protein
MSERLKPSNYQRAAEMVFAAQFGTEFTSCITLDNLRNDRQIGCPERRAFALMFSPKKAVDHFCASYQYKDWWNGDLNEQNQRHRATALLLMHEIAKDDPLLLEKLEQE